MAGRTVSITLGGKERQLKYDLNALAEIGERLGVTVRLEKFKEDLMSTPLPFSSLRVLLWAGLRHEAPDLTPEDVGEWVDLDNMTEVLERVFMLFGDKFSARVEEAVTQLTAAGASESPSTSTSDSPSSSESPIAASVSDPVSSGS